MFGVKVFAAFTLLSAAAFALTVDTPASLEECVPVALTWSGGTEPYYLSILPGGDSAGTALVNFGDVGDVVTYTWTVNVTEGTAVTIRVTDSTGTIAYSSEDTIQAGSTSCITTSDSTSSSSGTSSSTSTASAAASSASSSVSSATSAASSAASAASSSASSAASAASSAVSAASSSAASAASSASSAAASATSTKASSATKVVVGSFGALFLGAIGIVLA